MHAPTSHLPHVLMLLHSLERAHETGGGQDLTMPKDVFLLQERGSHLWELIGLRIRGLDTLFLGGVRFRKQQSGRGNLSRQSLVSFLSSPEREVSPSAVPRPAHLIEVMLPETPEPVLKFLERCRAGAEFPTMLVSRDDIELAFDFRLENPSMVRRPHGKAVERPTDRHLFRTQDGHLLSAVPHALPTKLHRDDTFLALTQPIQHSTIADRHLPTLVIHRRYLTLTAPMRGMLTPWLNHTLPFNAQLANSDHLLDRRLDSYRVYRERLVREQQRSLRSA